MQIKLIAETTSLPNTFLNNEIGLMTKSEFLKYQNEEKKYHPSDAYDYDLKSMNQDYNVYYKGKALTREGEYSIYNTSKKNSYIIKKDDKTVAVYIKGTLYHTIHVTSHELPTTFPTDRTREFIDLNVTKFKRVKYLNDHLKIVSNTAANNYKKYPVLVNRVKNFDGEYFEIRAETKLVKNEGIGLTVLNDEAKKIAIAQDEWGATLIAVVKEYQGKGLGKIIGKVWFKWNPAYRSGGFTHKGEQMAIGVWESRVREFLEKGWYSKLIKKNAISKEKINSILSDLSKKKTYKLTYKKKSVKPELVFLIEDNFFVIYDKAFYNIEDYYTYDDTITKTIYAHGFLRNDEHVGTYVYSIDYDPKYRKLATYIILQMAKDAREKLYYGKGYTDVIETEGLDHIRKEGDYISLIKDVIPIKNMAAIEKKYRKKRDKYGELYSILLESAESKWKITASILIANKIIQAFDMINESCNGT